MTTTTTEAAGSMAPVDPPWPSWRYAWRMHRFRPRRQLINLAGVLLGWTSIVLPGIAAKYAFDRIATLGPGDSLDWIWWPFALLAMQLVAEMITSITLQSTNGAFAFANAAMLQRNLLRRILQLPGGQALPSSPGEAISRFRDDTEAVVWYPIMFNNVIGSAVAGTVAIVVMARVNALVTAAVFLPVALVVLVVEVARRRIVEYRRANQVRTSQVTGFIGDVFAATQSVQVATAERRVVAKFRELNAHRRKAAVRDRLLEEMLKGAFWVVNLGTSIVMIFAGRALQSGSFTIGDFALFVYNLRMFDEFVRDFGAGLAGYRQLAVSFARMDELMAGTPAAALVADDEIYERGPLPPVGRPRPELAPFERVELEGLTYRHGGTGGGVEDVSLSMPAGSFTVVTGRVGAGKTTLLQSVLGLVPASGTIVWNDHAVDDPATFLVPPRIAYTPQVPQLFSTTLDDNIRLGVIDGDVEEAVHLAVLEDDLADMPDGLGTRIGSRGLRLSGGQIQRAAAARMFVRRPQLLVCDDLSSALDVETESLLWERVLTDRSRTVLAVSHRRAALQRADQVVVLRDGRVDAIGRLDDLLDRCEEMRRLWRLEEEAAAAAPAP